MIFYIGVIGWPVAFEKAAVRFVLLKSRYDLWGFEEAQSLFCYITVAFTKVAVHGSRQSADPTCQSLSLSPPCLLQRSCDHAAGLHRARAREGPRARAMAPPPPGLHLPQGQRWQPRVPLG